MFEKRLIETDSFDFEFLSQLAERESWRKEVHRPIYHIHKWWAKRLGSVLRGILLGSLLSPEDRVASKFYSLHDFAGLSVFDPFMGSGTTLGEAHKLGLTALGQDINPVAAEAVRIAMSNIDSKKLKTEFENLSKTVGEKIRNLYLSKDTHGQICDVLYYFWVMQVYCPICTSIVDLFPSWIIARNAYPERKPEIQILCPSCGSIFPGMYGQKTATCRLCGCKFSPDIGTTKKAKATCRNCGQDFIILEAISHGGKRPQFRLYGKLILTKDGQKEYIAVTETDLAAYEQCSQQLKQELKEGNLRLPDLKLEDGYNTNQAIGYGFRTWRDFFNDRQLLGLAWLNRAIADISDQTTRDAFLLLFSGILEFNNMFASYKGEGTGAVRHMFAHHILKPERTPIEANIWGTAKSSGSFSNLFRSRLLRAAEYLLIPTEVNGAANKKSIVCSKPFARKVEQQWPVDKNFLPHAIYLSCGTSSDSKLPDRCVDLVITDPPFFDNVHYSELADFFYSWQQLVPRGFINSRYSTRSEAEVQDTDPARFADKLQAVFQECYRVLKDDGLLVFTYHHSHNKGWSAVARAIFKAGFIVINSHPVKSEMSVAIPKSQANEPIQLDIIIVCRKNLANIVSTQDSAIQAIDKAKHKISRIEELDLSLSDNDRKVILYGQLLTSIKPIEDIDRMAEQVEQAISNIPKTMIVSPPHKS